MFDSKWGSLDQQNYTPTPTLPSTGCFGTVEHFQMYEFAVHHFWAQQHPDVRFDGDTKKFALVLDPEFLLLCG